LWTFLLLKNSLTSPLQVTNPHQTLETTATKEFGSVNNVYHSDLHSETHLS
jgi:hypothetical protein